MTKKDFDQKYSAAYKKALDTIMQENLIGKELEKNANADRKISNEELSASILRLSITINQVVLKSVLSEILEFDE